MPCCGTSAATVASSSARGVRTHCGATQQPARLKRCLGTARSRTGSLARSATTSPLPRSEAESRLPNSHQAPVCQEAHDSRAPASLGSRWLLPSPGSPHGGARPHLQPESTDRNGTLGCPPRLPGSRCEPLQMLLRVSGGVGVGTRRRCVIGRGCGPPMEAAHPQCLPHRSGLDRKEPPQRRRGRSCSRASSTRTATTERCKQQDQLLSVHPVPRVPGLFEGVPGSPVPWWHERILMGVVPAES